MFERLVSKALGDFLSKYFTEESLAKNGASKSAQLGVWSGYITLSNIELKKDVVNTKLQKKGQPFEIVHCTIRKVEITIPWAQMSNPIQSTDRSRDEGVVVVVLDGISLLVKTKFDFNDVALRQGEVEKRRKALQKATYTFNDESSRPSFSDSVKQRITSGLLQQIMDKLHIHIRDLHVRIEDVGSDPANPYAFGVTLESMHLHHNEDSGTDGNVVKKVMQLNHFAAYWNVCDYGPDVPEENSLLHQLYDDPEIVSQKLHSRISRRASLIASPSRNAHTPMHTYILLPVDGMMYLDLSTVPTDLTERPAMSANIVIDVVSTQLRDFQCVQMLRLYREIKNHQFVKKYRRFRPLVDVKENPRAWWGYAARVIKYQLKENFMRWSQLRFGEGYRARQRYMVLYEKKISRPNVKLEEKASILSLNNHPIALLKAQKSFEIAVNEGSESTTLTPGSKPSFPLQLQERGPTTLEELVELQALEDGKIGDLSVSDMILFRAIVNMRAGRPINNSQNGGNEAQSEGSWWTSSLAKAADDSDTRKEFDRLLKLLDDDHKNTAAPLLRNRLQTAVEASLQLQEISAAFFTPSHLTKDERPLRRLHNKFLEFKSLDVRPKIAMKGDYKTIDYHLSVMDVLGLEIGADIGDFVISSQATRVNPGQSVVDPDQSAEDSPFLQVAITKHPATPSACDLEVVIFMNSVEIYLAPDSNWIRNLQGIAKQLSGLPKVADFWKDLSVAYVNSLALGNLGLRAKAEYGVEDHKSIDVDITIECPKIRISDGDGWDLIIDLGSAVVKTAMLAGVSRANLRNSAVVVENNEADNMIAMMRSINGIDDSSAIGSEIGPSPAKYRFEVGTPNLKKGMFASSAMSVGSRAKSRSGSFVYDDTVSFRYDGGGDISVGGKSKTRVDGGTQMNEIFYDVYVFRLQTGKITLEGEESHELSPGFGISTTIKKSILPSDHTICKLKASTLIDRLSLNLNESSIMHFAKLLRIWKGITRVQSSSAGKNSLNPFPPRIGVLNDQIGNHMSQSRLEADIWDDSASLSQVDEGEFFDANDGYDTMSNSSARWFDDNWIADTESVIDAESRSLRGGRSRRKRSSSISETSSNSDSSFVGRKNVSGLYLSAENLEKLNEGISEADGSFGESEGSDDDSFHSVMSAGGQLKVLSELEKSIARTEKMLNQSQETAANIRNSDLGSHSEHSARQGMGVASKVELSRAIAELNILKALRADLSSMVEGVNREVLWNGEAGTSEDRSHLAKSADHHARAAKAILDAKHRRDSITRASITHNLTRNLNRELFQGSILVGKVQVTLQLEQEATGGTHLGNNGSVLKLVAEDTAVAVSKRRQDTKLFFSMDQMEISSSSKDDESSFLLLSCGGPDTLLPSHFPHLVSRSMEEKFIRGAFHITQLHKDSPSDTIAKNKKLRLVIGDIEATPCEQYLSPVLSFLSTRKKADDDFPKDDNAVPKQVAVGNHNSKTVAPPSGNLSDIAVRLSSVRLVLQQKRKVISAFAVSELSARLVKMESHLKNKLQLDLQCTNIQILEIESLESGFGGELFGRRDAFTSLVQMRARSELSPSRETGGWVLGMEKQKTRNEPLSADDLVRNVHIGVRLNPINITASPSGVRGFVESIDELKDSANKMKADKLATPAPSKAKGKDYKIPLRFRCDISLRRIAIAFYEAERDWWNLTTDGGSNLVIAFTVIVSLQGSTLGRKILSSQVALADVTVMRSFDEWPIVEPFTVASNISLATNSTKSEIPEKEMVELLIPNDPRVNEVKQFMDLFDWEHVSARNLSNGEARVSIKITPINVNVSAPVISLLTNSKETLQKVVSATKTGKKKVNNTESVPSSQSTTSVTSRRLFVSVEAIECIVLKEAESRPISSAKPLFSIQQKKLHIDFSSNATTNASLSIRELSLIDCTSIHGIRVLGEDPTGRESSDTQGPDFLFIELCSDMKSDGPNAAMLNIHWGRIQCLLIPSFVASLLAVSQDVKATLQSRAATPAAKPKMPKGNALSKLLCNPRDAKLTLKADAESFECVLPSRNLAEYVKTTRTDPIGVVSLRWKASLSMAAALDSLKDGSEPWMNLDLDGSFSDETDEGLFKDFSDRYLSKSSGILKGANEVGAFTARVGLTVTDFQVLRTDIMSTTLIVPSNGSKGASRLSKNRIAFKVCPPQAGEQRITNPIDLRLSYRAVGTFISDPISDDGHSPTVEISQLLELEATKAVDFLLYISHGERGWTEAHKVTVKPILDLLKKKQARRKKDDAGDAVPKREPQPNSIKALGMSATTLCSVRLPGFQVTCVPGGATNLNEAPIIKFELSSLSIGLAFLPVRKDMPGGLSTQKRAAAYEGQLAPERNVDIMHLIAAGWVDCVMSAHYHNRRLVAWEPFVEPWGVNMRFGANLAEVLKLPPILKKSFGESRSPDFDPWIVSKLNEGAADRLRDVGRLFRAPFHSVASKSSDGITHSDLSYLMLASTARRSILAAQYPTSESSNHKDARIFLLLPGQDSIGWLRGFGFPDTSKRASREVPEHYSISCVISDQKTLNVNLTGALIENVVGYINNSKKSGFESTAPHWIRNESGLTIRFREVLESDRVKLGEEAGKTVLSDGSQIPLTLKRSVSQSCDPHRAYIYLELGSPDDFDGRIDNGDIDESTGGNLDSFLYKTAAKIPVDTVGVHRYPLDKNVEMRTEAGVVVTDTRSLGWIIVRVALQGGTKVISVESPFIIRSSAGTDLLCELRERVSQSILWRYLIPKVDDQSGNDEHSGFVSIPADIVPLVHNRMYSFKVVAFFRETTAEIDLSSIPSFSDSAIKIPVPPPFSDLSVRKGLLQEREVILPTVEADAEPHSDPDASPGHFHLSVCSIRIGSLPGVTSGIKIPEQRMVLFRSPLVIKNFLALPVAVQIRVKYHDTLSNERASDRSSGMSREQSIIRKETFYMEWQDIGVLDCGQSTNWTGALSTDRVQIRVRFVGLDGDNSRRFPGWSSPVTIPTKDSDSLHLNKKKAAFDHLRLWDADEIPLDLSVALETGTHATDNEMSNIRQFSEGFSSGTRVVSLFVPYWIVDSTNADLEFSAGAPVAGQLDKHVSFDGGGGNGTGRGMLGLAELMDNDGFMNLPSKSPFGVMMIGDSTATRLTIRKRVSRISRRRNWRHPSPWSDPIPLQTGQNSKHDTTVLSYVDQSKTDPEDQGHFDRFVLRSSVQPAPDSFGGGLGTMLIHVVNRYAIINEIGRDIEILQGHEDGASFLVRASSKPQPFHFNVSRAIRFRFKEFGWDWSGKFHIRMNRREVTMRLRHKMKGEAIIVTVEVQTEKNSSTCFLVFRQSINPPFRLENQTMHPLYFGQSATARSSQEADADTMLLPYQSGDFAWDEPELRRRAVLIKYRDPRNGRDSSLGRFYLDRSVPGSKPNVENPMFAIEVVADGPTRVLRLTDATMPHTQKVSHERSGEKNDFGQVRVDRTFTVSLVVRLNHGLGISVVDWSPQELVYARLDDIQIERSVDQENDTVTLAIGNIKMNNQLWVTPYPVLLKMGKRSDSSSSLRRNRRNDAISISWRRPLTPSGGYGNVTILDMVELSTQPLFANVDGNLVHLLLRMMKQVTGTTSGTNSPTTLSRDDELKKVLSVHRDNDPSNVPAAKESTTALFNQDADGELITTAAIAAKLKSDPLPLVKFQPRGMERKKQKRQQFSSKTKRKYYIEKIKISAARADLSWSGPLPGRLSNLLLRALTFERLPLRLRPYSGSHAYGNSEDHVQALKSYYVSFWRILDLLMGLSYNPTFLSKAVVYTLRESLASSLEMLSESYSYNAKSLSRLLPDRESHLRVEDLQPIDEDVPQQSAKLSKALVSPVVRSVAFSLRFAAAVTSWISSILKYGPQNSTRLASRGMSRSRTPRVFARVDGKELLVEYVEGGNSGKSLLSRVRLGIHLGEGYIIHTEEARLMQENRLSHALDPNPLIFMVTSERVFLLNGTLDQAFCTVEWETTFLNLIDVELTTGERVSLREMIIWYLSEQDLRSAEDEENNLNANTNLLCLGMGALQSKHIFLPEAVAEQVVDKLRKVITGLKK